MTTRRTPGFSTAALLALGLFVAAPALRADDRPADAILAAIDAIQRPKLDREQAKDRAAVAAFSEASRKYAAERSSLIQELFRSHPEHPRTASLLLERWRNPYLGLENKPGDLIDEADRALAKLQDDKVRAEALFVKAGASMRMHPSQPESILPLVEDFLKAAPQDPRVPSLLYGIARSSKDEALRLSIEERILKDFPNASVAGSIRNLRKQRENVGKPFILEFVDAVKGDAVSIAGLKGKVVVIDFWATWCGPCIAEMPRMKGLYEKFHDNGVEFIGVSLDRPENEGGLKALKEYVAKNEIRWPQYYQGDGWESKFSMSQGIRAIPALFVVDQEGNLASVEARGRLEELLPELLAKGKPSL